MKWMLGRIPLFDWWQIPIINSTKERMGYPTQKPEALLERIIKASTNERRPSAGRLLWLWHATVAVAGV